MCYENKTYCLKFCTFWLNTKLLCRYTPYQRPTPAVPSASVPSIAVPVASTGAPEPPSFQLGTLPSQPYYLSHFMRGLFKLF